MLVDLTPNLEVVEELKKNAIELDFKEFRSQTDPELRIEKGIYYSAGGLNFRCYEFVEKLDEYNLNENILKSLKKENETLLQCMGRTKYKWIDQYGIADNVDQVKNFYKKQIKDKNNKFVIAISPMFQEKGATGGFRWHKNGRYIGDLKPECEYLDDEDFGPLFCGYVLCFHLYKVL